MIIEVPKPYKFNYVSFCFPQERWQEVGYWNLRKEIFCKEQEIFEEHDQDAIDQNAIPIVALDECMGIVHNTVGAVRIDERSPRIWWGSRLCVQKNYRTHSRFNTNFLFDKDVNPLFTLSIGAALIYKAVSTANHLGCDHFYAHVQQQNVKLFQRLHWKPICEVMLHGNILHTLMEADLRHYPASQLAEMMNKVA